MKRLSVLLLFWIAALATATAQPLPARANVTPYYEDADIEKGAYRESPYYMELTGSWQRQHTDSSVCYSREIDAEKNWADYLVYLNVRCGRAVHVYLNDYELGYADDSRHWNEFLLSPYLRAGRLNKLTIEAMTDARGALLEDKALLAGLNGEPYLLFKSDPGVVDYSIVADYDAATTSGIFTMYANVLCGKRKGKYYLEVELWDPQGHNFDRMGRWVVFSGKSKETLDLSRTWTGVQPWNAESPKLYTAIIRLRNERMEEEETVGTRFGFRRVEVKDGLLQLNGKAITIRGVTYGIEHTEGSASREQMRRDVETMKRHNINAVRTARFSPMDPYFYELCDRYGLYVVCDANLMPVSEQHQVVATDQNFLPLFERRVENLYGRYKNHTSIIAWSLGNSRDNGVCMTAAYKRLKALEKTRPVVFSGADHSESTDIIAPLLPEVANLKQSLKKQGTRPYIMLAAVDAAGFSRLEPLWQLVLGQRQLQGGFVDAWPLSETRLTELKQLFCPFDVSLSKISPDEGEFVVFNRNDFATFATTNLDYNIFTNRRSAITGGDLPVAVSAGSSDKVSMRIPHVDLQAGEELFIRFNLTTRRNARQPWQRDIDLPLGTVEFPLTQLRPARRLFVNDGPALPDSLDAQTLLPQQLYFVGHEEWTATCVGRQSRKPDERTLCVDYMWRYTAADGTTMCDVRSTYTHFSTGDVLVDYTIAATDRLQGGKLQPALLIGIGADSITWFGLDREVCFSGAHSGQTGIYTQPASGLSRQQVRWCAARRGGEGLFVEVLGEQCRLSADTRHLRMVPSSATTLRLHLKPFREGNPADFAGIEYPRMVAGVLEPPTINAAEVRFSAPLAVTITSKAPCEIRYTLDGSEPTEASPRYTGPITIGTTTVVKARAFAKGMPPSFTSTRRFNYDYIVTTAFSRKANTPYNVGADTLLFDGQKGTVDELNRGWLGFAGEPVTTTVMLAKPIAVAHLTLRYAHAPATWAFAPREVTLLLSTDGVNFSDTVKTLLPFDPADEAENSPRVVELNVPVGRAAVQAVKIIPTTIGAIPAWHRAKGLKPWMMMDEIEVAEQ